MIKNKNKNAGRDLALLLGGAAVVFTPLVVTSCDDKPKPEVEIPTIPDPACTDAAGTIHLAGEEPSCRGKKECACEFDIPGTRASNGIAITNRQNVAGFDAKVSEITPVIEYFTGNKGKYIADTIKEIKIVSGTGGLLTIEDGVMTIKIEHTAGDVYEVLNTYTTSISLFKQFDNSKDNVKLAFAYNGVRLSNCLMCNCA